MAPLFAARRLCRKLIFKGRISEAPLFHSTPPGRALRSFVLFRVERPIINTRGPITDERRE